MAEYYPLLAKAVGSLPSSTPETRRVVYERARKALIGQLRTLHPPVPDDDIEHESDALDRAVERLESELAKATPVAAGAETPLPPAVEQRKPNPPVGLGTSGSLGPPARNPQLPMRTKGKAAKPLPNGPAAEMPPLPAPPHAGAPSSPPAGSMPAASGPGALAPNGMVPSANVPPVNVPAVNVPPVMAPSITTPPDPSETMTGASSPAIDSGDGRRPRAVSGVDGKPRLEPQRPIAPQPAAAVPSRRGLWILFAAIGLVVALVAAAAWTLRDRPEAIVAAKPTPQVQDSGKIAGRVGEKTTAATGQDKSDTASSQAASAQQATAVDTGTSSTSSPELPITHRAALLIEAPDDPAKVKTILGTVVWKLNNVSAGPSDAVGVAVQADIDLPNDKMRVIITFEKNTDSSLPASHTIKIRFIVAPGSATGDVKQISVPQMRREDSPSGDALAGVTVPVVQNTFLVGLSPGNAETANLELLKQLQWMDIPMLLATGKIAKLTFEKSDSGQRDFNEAIAAWQKS